MTTTTMPTKFDDDSLARLVLSLSFVSLLFFAEHRKHVEINAVAGGNEAINQKERTKNSSATRGN